MSTLKVNAIEPYTGGTVTITGATVDNATSASYALTATTADVANGLSSGNKTLSGALTQNFTAPGLNEEIGFANVSGASVNGKNYNRVFYGIADYPGFGVLFEDYFAIEYYDSFGYNFGTELNLNGAGAKFFLVPSGSGFSQAAVLEVKDQYDGTSLAQILGTKVNVGSVAQTTEVNIGGANTNNINITGSVNIADTITLASQDPLPSGSLGQLAVSGSGLYFYNGSTWGLIS